MQMTDRFDSRGMNVEYVFPVQGTSSFNHGQETDWSILWIADHVFQKVNLISVHSQILLTTTATVGGIWRGSFGSF